ncbi:YoaK family protein [Pseudonocardia spinosispora]|uniref:YoaK family protein n=1 Tax=Pseudonocardia spinosispora TaxID=103441 RepID=UPI00040EA223|nr:YoaK family protein [Pseudonocardia spinosispora]
MDGSRTTSGTLRLAALLAVAGGYLDGFMFIGHGGVFANAQTGNVVLLGVSAARADWRGAVRHVLPIVAFVLGVATAETVGHPWVARRIRRPARVALALEIVVLAVVGALPGTLNSTVIVLAVAYAAAMQNSTFGKLRDWSVNTTMTTGNLRTASQATYRAVIRRLPGSAEQARAFGAICLAFLVGAALGAVATGWWGNRAAWGAVLLLLVGLLMFVVDERG